MGRGIAQVFAQHGFSTSLFDIDARTLEKAKAAIEANLEQLAGKQKITAEEKENALNHVRFEDDIKACSADLIIEAVAEDIEAKIRLFNQLPQATNAGIIFVTNTSSLSVSEIQRNIMYPERVAGMHFFNPATVMKLVEVIKGKLTNSATIEIICRLCERINKTAVVCGDSPGFIVNRVARPYYIEAMRLVEDGVATLEDVDIVMEATGFKLGPFKLMDLIGLDVNLSVSRSVFEALHKAERLRPGSLQIEKVKKGELGKKTGKGFYNYAESD